MKQLLVIILVFLLTACATSSKPEAYPPETGTEVEDTPELPESTKVEVTDAMRDHQRYAMEMNEAYEVDEVMVPLGVHLVSAGRDCDALLVEARYLSDALVEQIHNRPRLGPGSWWKEKGYRGVAYMDREGYLMLYGDLTEGEVRNGWVTCPEAFK